MIIHTHLYHVTLSTGSVGNNGSKSNNFIYIYVYRQIYTYIHVQIFVK